MNNESFDDLNTEFYSLLSSFIKKIAVVDRNEKYCYGVTLSQCYSIETLSARGALSMNELSADLGIAISTLTRNVDVLERDGVVERKRSSKDRRKVIVELTAKGRELNEKLQSCSIDLTGEILKIIPANKKESVVDCLKLLNEAISQFEANQQIDTNCCSVINQNKKG
ncbi:MAG: MarR family transcriptional regulator [bacterium]|nr:MarR family transcriptional regulator [bacterium]